MKMMTCTSAGDALCSAFIEFSRLCWTDLSDASSIASSREFVLSEESITDYRLLGLGKQKAFLASRGYRLSLIKFNKIEEGKTTGADWQWVFVGSGGWIAMRVQAKKLDSNLRYSGLLQKSKKGKFQYNRLIEDAESSSFFPVYCFYNHSTSPAYKVPLNCPCFANVDDWGASVSDAYAVKRRAMQKKITFDEISPISVPLPHLFCCFPFNNHFESLPEFIRTQLELLKGVTGTRRRVPEIRTDLPSYLSLIEAGELGLEVRQLESLRNVDGVMIMREENR